MARWLRENSRYKVTESSRIMSRKADGDNDDMPRCPLRDKCGCVAGGGGVAVGVQGLWHTRVLQRSLLLGAKLVSALLFP